MWTQKLYDICILHNCNISCLYGSIADDIFLLSGKLFAVYFPACLLQLQFWWIEVWNINNIRWKSKDKIFDFIRNICVAKAVSTYSPVQTKTAVLCKIILDFMLKTKIRAYSGFKSSQNWNQEALGNLNISINYDR